MLDNIVQIAGKLSCPSLKKVKIIIKKLKSKEKSIKYQQNSIYMWQAYVVLYLYFDYTMSTEAVVFIYKWV